MLPARTASRADAPPKAPVEYTTQNMSLAASLMAKGCPLKHVQQIDQSSIHAFFFDRTPALEAMARDYFDRVLLVLPQDFMRCYNELRTAVKRSESAPA